MLKFRTRFPRTWRGEEGLLGHRPRGGDVESSGGDSKLPFHSLHHLPRLPPWFKGGSRHRYRHPRGQAATAACGLEGGGPVHDIPGPAQGVLRLGQVQTPGNPGGIRRRPQG